MIEKDGMCQQPALHGSSVKITLIKRTLENRAGGAERIFCELAGLLSEHGYDVSCLTWDEPNARPFYPLDPRVKLINLGTSRRRARDIILMISYKLLPKSLSIRQRMRWQAKHYTMIEQLRRYQRADQPDLIISFLPNANTPVLYAMQDVATRVIATNHNIPAEDYENPKRYGGSVFDRKMMLEALDHADVIHVLFPSFGSWFPAELQDRIFAIPNYVSDEILRSEANIESKENLIIGVGRLTDIKDYEILLRAWASLPEHHANWRVKIFGSGPQRQNLEEMIDQLKVGETFELCGVTQQIGKEYLKASIFCHPAKFEGFGLSVSEALACKIPVLAFASTPGIDQFLVSDINSILVPRTEDAVSNFAHGLRRLIEDRSLRANLGKAGPESIKEFNFENYERNWLRLVSETVRRA